jgi:hypothetical protein
VRRNNDAVGPFWNSKIGQIARTPFSECGWRKMKFDRLALEPARTIMELALDADSLEEYFATQANSATAILFSWGHWRSWPINTD